MTTTARIVRLFALLWLGAIVSAQVRDAPARPVAGTSVISGTVVAGVTGNAPARRARVTLRSTDGVVEARTATTDDDGRFEFAALPAGRFTLDVRKPGYLAGSYGAAKPERDGSPVSIGNGARVTGLTIRIVRGAAVTGTVRDSRGRPVPGVSVSALRFTYSYFFGERNVNPSGGATTDDRGVYRLWGLSAGDYVIAATPSVAPTGGTTGPGFHRQTADEIDLLVGVPRGVNIGVGSQPGDGRKLESTSNYSPVFHPGTADFESAATFSLGDEEERAGIDIAISLVPTSRITGLVRMADGRAAAPVTITLSSAAESASVLVNASFMRAVTARTDPEGRFAFEDVPSGRFKVLAKLESRPAAMPRAPGVPSTFPNSNPFLWASTIVDMRGTPVSVQLDLQPSQTITGRLVFDGASPPPRDVTGLSIRLNPPGGGANLGNGLNANVNSDHTFTLNGITPDTYRLIELRQRPWEGSWQLKSAVAGGRDAFDASLVVAAGESLELVLTYTDRPSQLTGTFQDSSGRPAPDYFIVIFPADRKYWTSIRRAFSTRPASDGHYSMEGIPTGEYLIAALTDFRREDMLSLIHI